MRETCKQNGEKMTSNKAQNSLTTHFHNLAPFS